MNSIKDIRNKLTIKYTNKEFVEDKTGVKTIELIGESFLADEPTIFAPVNQEYIDREIEWYLSQSTNINDIYGEERDAPAAWKYAADKYGNINSNYGLLIFAPKYFSQFAEVQYELSINPNSRRAVMIYNRPSIWEEYKENGKSDFICTNAVNYFIRDNKLNAVVQMRSNDVVFGYRNDKAWQDYVMKELADSLNVEVGDMFWNAASLHIYEKHFKYLDEYLGI